MSTQGWAGSADGSPVDVSDTLADLGQGANGFGIPGALPNPNLQQSPAFDFQHPRPGSDALLEGVDVVDMRDRQDALALNENTMEPGYRYRWCQIRPENMTNKRLKGYEVVLRSRDSVRPIYDVEEGEAGDMIRRGDTVLMKIRDHRLQRNRDYREQIGRLRIRNSNQRFLDKAAQSRTASGEPIRVFEQDRLRGEPGE